MGYTHYWKQNGSFTDEAWKTLKTVFEHVQTTTGIPVQEEYDDASPPVLDSVEIFFNGVGDDGHETFSLGRHDDGRNFCKTAQKPYDVYVVALLHAASQVNEGFSWSSDGNEKDHAAGVALADHVLSSPEFMTIEQAVDIVYDLAVQNALSDDLDELDEMYDEMRRQHVALDTFHDFAVNNIHE